MESPRGVRCSFGRLIPNLKTWTTNWSRRWQTNEERSANTPRDDPGRNGAIFGGHRKEAIVGMYHSELGMRFDGRLWCGSDDKAPAVDVAASTVKVMPIWNNNLPGVAV